MVNGSCSFFKDICAKVKKKYLETVLNYIHQFPINLKLNMFMRFVLLNSELYTFNKDEKQKSSF